MAATTETPKIRHNSLVIYRGSLTSYNGILFTVVSVDTIRGETRYTLAYRGGTETVLRRVSAGSLTVVAARDILHRTCEVCEWGPYWYIRGGDTDCPICAGPLEV